MTADLIRWTGNGDGGYLGYAGTADRWLFEIFRPGQRDLDWMLISSPALGQGKALSFGADAGPLKERAAALLREFAASIGAVFPDAGETHEITGTVSLMYHDEGDAKACIDCPDFPGHVFGSRLDLPEYASRFPKHFGRSLDYWVESVYRFKSLEGRRIRVTATLLESDED